MLTEAHFSSRDILRLRAWYYVRFCPGNGFRSHRSCLSLSFTHPAAKGQVHLQQLVIMVWEKIVIDLIRPLPQIKFTLAAHSGYLSVYWQWNLSLQTFLGWHPPCRRARRSTWDHSHPPVSPCQSAFRGRSQSYLSAAWVWQPSPGDYDCISQRCFFASMFRSFRK